MIRLNRGNLRAAAIVAAATATLAGGSAFAAVATNSAASHPSPSAHSDASVDVKGTPTHAPETARPESSSRPEPSEKPDPSESAEATGEDSDAHGDCVSKVAEDHSATAAGKHGKSTHGAAVSKAAHDCPK